MSPGLGASFYLRDPLCHGHTPHVGSAPQTMSILQDHRSRSLPLSAAHTPASHPLPHLDPGSQKSTQKPQWERRRVRPSTTSMTSAGLHAPGSALMEPRGRRRLGNPRAALLSLPANLKFKQAASSQLLLLQLRLQRNVTTSKAGEKAQHDYIHL